MTYEKCIEYFEERLNLQRSGHIIACDEDDDACETAIDALKNVKSSTEEDCASCQYYERTADQYPCSHCRNCYTSKFKAKL